jgi:hypothetical protein
MRNIFICFMILLVLFGSCKKDKDEARKAVYAGLYDTTFIYHEFVPPFKVNILWDSLNYYGDGKDSIDLSLDSNYDLLISFHLLYDENYQTYHEGSPLQFNCKLIPKNGLEIATQIESITVHGSTTISLTWVDALKYNESIDNISSWSSGETMMWCGDTYTMFSSGCWFKLSNSEMYIGIRMKNNSQYKYGWIKVNGISRENILFLSYALEK